MIETEDNTVEGKKSSSNAGKFDKPQSGQEIDGVWHSREALRHPEQFEIFRCRRKGELFMVKKGCTPKGSNVFCPKCRLLPTMPPPTVETIMDYVVVDPITGCWNWKYFHNSEGRATVYLGKSGGSISAAKYIWQLFNGPMPDGFESCHECDRGSVDNPLECGACVRPHPEHVVAGTHHKNMSDMSARQLNPRGEKHYKAKLTEELVRDLRRRHAAGEPMTVLAAELNLTHPTVRYAIIRKTWKHVE